MKSLIKGVVAGLALSVALSGIASAQTIRMGTEGAYPPYNFINDSGQVDGFERELGDELCKRAGLTCEWVTNEGFDHPEPCFGQLRHHHRRHVDH